MLSISTIIFPLRFAMPCIAAFNFIHTGWYMLFSDTVFRYDKSKTILEEDFLKIRP